MLKRKSVTKGSLGIEYINFSFFLGFSCSIYYFIVGQLKKCLLDVQTITVFMRRGNVMVTMIAWMGLTNIQIAVCFF